MARRASLLLLVLPLLLLWGDGLTATEDETAVFLGAALRGIGARATECPPPIVRETAAREMAVMCARFDGDFNSFRSKWAEWTSRAEPKTGWDASGLNHDRVYAVGERAVGVRFTLGDILIVYK